MTRASASPSSVRSGTSSSMEKSDRMRVRWELSRVFRFGRLSAQTMVPRARSSYMSEMLLRICAVKIGIAPHLRAHAPYAQCFVRELIL